MVEIDVFGRTHRVQQPERNGIGRGRMGGCHRVEGDDARPAGDELHGALTLSRAPEEERSQRSVDLDLITGA